MELLITAGSRKGLVFPLDGRVVTVGRDPSCAIAVDDHRASRKHFQIELDGGSWVLRDLESTNFTYVNDRPVDCIVLKDGDEIRIGSTIFSVHGATTEESTRLSPEIAKPSSKAPPPSTPQSAVAPDAHVPHGDVPSSKTVDAPPPFSLTPPPKALTPEYLAQVSASSSAAQTTGSEDVGALAGAASSAEISLSMDAHTLQLALRNNPDSESLTLGMSLSEALFQISMLANVSADPDQFLLAASRVLNQVLEHTSWAWIDWPSGLEEPYRLRGRRGQRTVYGDDMGISRSLLDRAIRERTGITSSELQEQFEMSIAIRQQPVAAALAVPLSSGEDLVGLLYLDRESPLPAFSRQELETAAILGSQMAIHIENILLFHKLQEAFEELRVSQSELVKSEKLAGIGRLASGFAHDLNNPLASLMGFLELAQRNLKKSQSTGNFDKLENYLTKAQGAADFCRALSRNLLAFARQRPANLDSVHEFSVSQTIESTLNICNSAINRANAEIETHLNPELTLSGDPSALQQIVMNLVTNAADALAESVSDRLPCITIETQGDHQGIVLTIGDNGPGIPEEIRDRVFEPLFTTKGEDRGTGLGLFVVGRIIEESGGTLQLDTRTGEGTTFTVTLPHQLSSLKDEEEHSPETVNAL